MPPRFAIAEAGKSRLVTREEFEAEVRARQPERYKIFALGLYSPDLPPRDWIWVPVQALPGPRVFRLEEVLEAMERMKISPVLVGLVPDREAGGWMICVYVTGAMGKTLPLPAGEEGGIRDGNREGD